MAKILQFPPQTGNFIASIDLFREADGSITARLADMDPGTINAMGGEAFDKMLELALWTQLGAESFAKQADALREG